VLKAVHPAEDAEERGRQKKRKNSHLPCAGIILFRFYGYYLSLFPPAFQPTGLQHPGNLKKPVFRR
jgi:hypothetical protein